MNRTYLFESDRLGFRNWEKNDILEFANINADSEVMKYFPKVLTLAETESFIVYLQKQFVERGYTYFATEILETGEFIGFIGLLYQDYEASFTPGVDIGWRLKKTAWGNGYATEGAIRCLNFAFEKLELLKVFSVCPMINKDSEKVMKKIGMNKKEEFFHPKLSDYPTIEKCALYEIEKKNYDV